MKKSKKYTGWKLHNALIEIYWLNDDARVVRIENQAFYSRKHIRKYAQR